MKLSDLAKAEVLYKKRAEAIDMHDAATASGTSLEVIIAAPGAYTSFRCSWRAVIASVQPALVAGLRECIEEIEANLRALGVEVDPYFPKDVDGWLKPTTPVAPYLIERGYNLIGTGGGCKAWVKIMPDGEHVVVTSEDGGSEPQQDDWLIGRYADENWEGGYSVGTMDGESLEPFKKSLSDVESVTTTEESGHATESSPQKRGGRS